jgi:hypothetical protein
MAAREAAARLPTSSRSSSFDGPRLDAPLAAPSLPLPAAEGRGWNHLGEENGCPSSAEPTTAPSRSSSEPLARYGNSACATPVAASG